MPSSYPKMLKVIFLRALSKKASPLATINGFLWPVMTGGNVKLYSYSLCNGIQMDLTNANQCMLKNQHKPLYSARSFTAQAHWKRKLKPLNFKRSKPKRRQTGQVLEISENMTVEDVARITGRSLDVVFDALNYVVGGELYDTKNTQIDDINIIIEVVKKCGFRYKIAANATSSKKPTIEDAYPPVITDTSRLLPRPPVITVMGHVDHGKTTLLDTLRNARIVDEEFGGITQHIGAFTLQLRNGDSMTFIDTPGHAAFSAMRARGAMVTDIIVLVVAADDGVMQQTMESLDHAKRANVPIIVAINKIDKPRANIKEVMDGLMEVGVAVEQLGGDVQAVPISALVGSGVDQLQEAIITLAELMQLRADPRGSVVGVVIESRTDRTRGKLATAVIQEGTLTRGMYIVAGTASGKVRALFNDKFQPINAAHPSSPVEIVGWKDLPSAGDQILEVDSEARMKEVIKLRELKEAERKLIQDSKAIEVKREKHEMAYSANLREKHANGFRYYRGSMRMKESLENHAGPRLAMVLKGDVDGSLEAILDTIDTYDSLKCELDVVHFGVGSITPADVDLAHSFGAIIYGFNVTLSPNIRTMAEDKGVPIRIHNVIYSLFDDLKTDLTAKLPPAIHEDILGEATVQEVYNITERKRKVSVAGCRCTKGTIWRKHMFRIVRDGEAIHEGKLSSLRHFKSEVDTIKQDTECGLSFEDKTVDFVRGDLIQCYSHTPVLQPIDWNLGF